MSLNRWKVLAATLTIGVGGLAVCAAPTFGKKVEAQNAKATKDKPPAVTGSDTSAPAVKPDADTPVNIPVLETPPPAPLKGVEFEIDVPTLPPAKSKVEETLPPPVKTNNDAVTIPPLPVLIPVKGEEKAPTKKDTPKKEELKKDEPKTIDVPKVDVPKIDLDPPAVFTPPPLPAPVKKDDKPKVAPPPPPPAVPLPEIKPMPAPTPPPMVTPVPFTTPSPETLTPKPAPTVKPDTAKLKMLLRMGDGKPRFEIRNTQTTELLMKVYGDRIEMQTPPEGKSTLSGVTANGNVRFTAPGVEGTCDQLTILSGTGEVLLKGNIHLKAKFGKSSSEITAEKMVYQIGAQGLVAPNRGTVTPAKHVDE